MIPTRPYLVRAFYEWIVDNDWTPHVVVNAEYDDVEVPLEYVDNGQIVLNVAMSAVQNLLLENDAISFKARFGGVSHSIFVPIAAIMAIYARENGRGMVFSEDDEPPPETGGRKKAPKDFVRSRSGEKESGNKKPHLTIVKK